MYCVDIVTIPQDKRKASAKDIDFDKLIILIHKNYKGLVLSAISYIGF